MTETDLSLLIAAILVAALSWRYNRRGVLWICVAAMSFVLGDIAWRTPLPYAEAITGMGDAGVCLAVYFKYRERWELVFWRLYQTSVAISFFYLAGNLGLFIPIGNMHLSFAISHETYGILMELINWLALLLIGGVGAAQWLGASNARAGRFRNYMGALGMALREGRKTPSFLAKT